MSTGFSWRISPIDHFLGKIFQLKRDHPLGKTKLKTLYKISSENKLEKGNTKEEKQGEKDSPPHYSEIKERKRDINESQAQEWMDAKIKIKEINIAT